jgi:hypothetical protein
LVVDFLKEIPPKKLAIIIGVVTAVAWLLLPRTLAMVIAIVGGGLLAWRSLSGPGPATG